MRTMSENKSKNSIKPIDTVKRILFMDDEVLISMTTESILSKAGFSVSLASDGAEAVEIFRRAVSEGNPFRLVILDLNIPGGMGGEEAVRELMKIRPDLKAIVTSGYLNDKVMSDCNRYGFIESLAKPFTSEELIEIVSKNI